MVNISVTGNPGIGKSRFYLYCIFRIIKERCLENKKLIINCKSDYYLNVNYEFHELTDQEVRKHKRDSNVVRLIDGYSSMLGGWVGTSVLFASPGIIQYEEYMKRKGLEIVMPPWTYEELKVANSEVVDINDAKLMKHHSFFGGIARFAFCDDMLGHMYKQQVLMELQLPSKVLQLLESLSAGFNVSQSHYTHKLLHMIPLHKDKLPFDGFYLKFASPEIGDLVYEKMRLHCFSQLKTFALSSSKDEMTRVAKGHVFEILCHHIFYGPDAENCQLEGKYLMSDFSSSAAEDEVFSIEVAPLGRASWFRSLDELALPSTEAMYCRPKTNTFPCIDAIYWDTNMCYLLQMTISNNHGISYAPLKKILEWCARQGLDKSKYVFVFIIPRDGMSGFKWQKYLTNSKGEHTRLCDTVKQLKQCVVGANQSYFPGPDLLVQS